MRRLVLALLLVTFSAVPAAAYHDREVLGESIQLSDTVFPAITSGPGHILPDSPLYFIDRTYQNFRLALVFTSEAKAKLHADILGERLAELRVVAMRDKKAAITAVLAEIEKEALASATELKDASAQGKDVTQLARTIHQLLADYRGVIVAVKAQVPDTSFEQKLATTADVLWEAKIISEDALPTGDLEAELAANIDEQLEEEVMGIASSAGRLEKRLSAYEKLASRAAEREAKKQQEQANREALQAKQKELIAQRQKAVQDYLKRAEALRKQREQELADLKKTIRDLQEQLRQLRRSQVGTQSGTVLLSPSPTKTPLNTTQ